MKLPALFCILFVGIGVGAQRYQPASRIVDLTHPFSDSSVYWPTADGFRLHVDSRGVTEKGFYYSAYSFTAAEHGGTHIDAPVHFAEGHPAVDEIPLERLVGPGVLIDLADKVGENTDYQIQVDDLMQWESSHARLPDGHLILLRTGWGRFYPDRERYLGTAERGALAVSDLHFPGLHPEAARWLVENRDVAAIGLDTASIDFGQSELFESHQILFKADIPVFENVASLEALPESGFEVIALPMKIQGGSGGPLRIIAVFR